MIARIRRATPQDAAVIAGLHHTTRVVAYAGTGMAPTPLDQLMQRWERILAEPDAPVSATFIAEDAGRPLGFCACGPQRDEAMARAGFGGEFLSIYVLPEAQRLGLGQRLMGAAARRLLAHRMDAATLWVLAANESAREFYATLGAAEIARREVDGHMQVAAGWRGLMGLAAA